MCFHVFSALSILFPLRSSTIIPSHCSLKWTPRDSQQACRISASCIFRSSTSLSWVPDSCQYLMMANTRQIYWTKMNKQGFPTRSALKSVPTCSWLLWAVLIKYNGEVQTFQKIDKKTSSHGISRESELGSPGYSDIFKCLQIMIGCTQFGTGMN